LPPLPSTVPQESDPGQVITNQELRELYRRFIDSVRDIHADIVMEVNHMEIWARFDDTVVCRLVPYRELFHVQVGQENIWEIRVRNRLGCLETMDRVLSRFLEIYAKRSVNRSANRSI